jgi:hypothetical protein
MRPYLEKPLHKKRAGAVAQDVGHEFKPHYQKKIVHIEELPCNVSIHAYIV